MDLPKRMLDNLKYNLMVSDDAYQYEGEEGVRKLARDIGDSLELFDSVRAKFVFEHSYDYIVSDVYHDVEITHDEWKKNILLGLGNNHLDLQTSYMSNELNKRTLKEIDR